jgi:hypothetical protein
MAATKSWKEKFAQELLQIRLKVRAEKALAAQAAADNPLAPRVRKTISGREAPKAAMSVKRKSKYSTDASFAKSFLAWFVSQTQFQRQQDLADTLKIDGETLSSWINSKKFPRGRFCDELYRITELECFGPEGRRLARREHRAKKLRR